MFIRSYWLILILVCLSFTSLTAAEDLELWNRARALAKANLNLIPGITRHEMETVDRSGKILHSSDITVAHHQNEQGEIVTVLHNKETGGEEIDDTANEEMVQQMLKQDLTPKREGIFYTDVGEKLSLEFTGNRKEFDGFNCLEYKTNYTTTGEDDREVTFSGSFWLEEESGAPIYNVFTMDRTPRFVREITIERWYDYDRDSGRWHLREMFSTAEIRFLLKRMTNTMRMTYSDYWEYVPEAVDR